LKYIKFAACDRQIAQALSCQCLRNSPTALGAFYRRLRSRVGAPKAITATAHKLARLFYGLWTTGQEYTDLGVDSYEQQYQERMVKNLTKKAQALGFSLVPQILFSILLLLKIRIWVL
jgi:DICT domain-containing protein